MRQSDFTQPAAPLRYSPALEHPEPDEAETTRQLVETMRSINETTFRNSGCPLRSVHAKAHGLLTGEFTVLPDLPAVLAQGMFAKTAAYPVVLRFSTSPGDLLDDSVSTPRGLAIKVIGVAGERLQGAGGNTQDFLLVNGPAFSAPNPKKFLGNLKMLAATTDKGEGLKKLASAALRGVESIVETFGGKSPTLMTLGGHPETHILGETFFSQVPVRFGDYVAKIALAPVSTELAALKDAPLDCNGKPNALREAIQQLFAANGGEWELRVQLCTDLETMPIEDASVVWPEDKSNYVAVARINVPAQPAYNDARFMSINENLSFSPWHGLAAHQPLGGIMRSRRPAYEMSAAFRNDHGAHISEPRSIEELLV